MSHDIAEPKFRMAIRCLAGAVALAAVFALAPQAGGKAAAQSGGQKLEPSFFNTVELQSSDLRAFKKWRSAIGRYFQEAKQGAKRQLNCNTQRLNICDYGDWAKFIASLKDKGRWAQLQAVNERMNQAKYIADQTNWGQSDYWATPGEFMDRFGDCEDYAIVKYLSLRLLGFSEDELRVVAVKDLNLKVGHAILMVILRDSKNRQRFFVLDNQIQQVVEAYKIRHYQPVFSINQTHWWRHLPRTGAG